MLKPKMGNVIVVLISLSMTGCGIYDKYGHGRVVSSKLDEASVTPVDLPPNAPSISQRFLPQGVSSTISWCHPVPRCLPPLTAW